MNCPITENTIKKMIKIAKETRKNAFSCRSKHKIWASILTASWKIYGWCNVECNISWLWTCAERCAIDNMVSNWEYNIIAACTIDTKFTPTCWACLQYLTLFSQISDNEIWLINGDVRWHYEIKTLSELLPEWYKTTSTLDIIKSYNKKKRKK